MSIKNLERREKVLELFKVKKNFEKISEERALSLENMELLKICKERDEMIAAIKTVDATLADKNEKKFITGQFEYSLNYSFSLQENVRQAEAEIDLTQERIQKCQEKLQRSIKQVEVVGEKLSVNRCMINAHIESKHILDNS